MSFVRVRYIRMTQGKGEREGDCNLIPSIPLTLTETHIHTLTREH